LVVEDDQTGRTIRRCEDSVARVFEKELADLKPDDFVIDAKNDMSILWQKGLRSGVCKVALRISLKRPVVWVFEIVADTTSFYAVI